MLTKRIIPCLDVKDGRVVKGINFKQLVDAGDPVAAAIRYEKQGADELVFLDITASTDNRSTVFNMVEKVAKNLFLPFTVGGGIDNVDTIRKLLMLGADKISINSAAVRNPQLVKESSERFGAQCTIVAIDAKKQPGGWWQVYTHGGTRETGLDAIEWAKEVYALGAGELLVTSMDRDGTKDGYDLELLHELKMAVPIPIIASGGAGKKSDFYNALCDGYADAALAASLFHFGELTIPDLKKYLHKKGIPMRMTGISYSTGQGIKKERPARKGLFR